MTSTVAGIVQRLGGPVRYRHGQKAYADILMDSAEEQEEAPQAGDAGLTIRVHAFKTDGGTQDNLPGWQGLVVRKCCTCLCLHV